MSSKETLGNCPVCHGEGRLRQDLERPNVKISVPCPYCKRGEYEREIPIGHHSKMATNGPDVPHVEK